MVNVLLKQLLVFFSGSLHMGHITSCIGSKHWHRIFSDVGLHKEWRSVGAHYTFLPLGPRVG